MNLKLYIPGRLSTTIVMLPVKTQEFGQRDATGLLKRAVGIVILSDGLGSPSVKLLCNL